MKMLLSLPLGYSATCEASEISEGYLSRNFSMMCSYFLLTVYKIYRFIDLQLIDYKAWQAL